MALFVMEVEEAEMEVSLLNPMVFYPRFEHIAETIFQKVDKKSIRNLRLISKPFQEYIDDRNILWRKIMKDEDSNEAFQSALINGHTKMTEFLIQKSIEFGIDLRL